MSVGKGVGLKTPGVGARVLLVPWAATNGSVMRAAMIFIFSIIDVIDWCGSI